MSKDKMMMEAIMNELKKHEMEADGLSKSEEL